MPSSRPCDCSGVEVGVVIAGEIWWFGIVGLSGCRAGVAQSSGVCLPVLVRIVQASDGGERIRVSTVTRS